MIDIDRKIKILKIACKCSGDYREIFKAITDDTFSEHVNIDQKIEIARIVAEYSLNYKDVLKAITQE